MADIGAALTGAGPSPLPEGVRPGWVTGLVGPAGSGLTRLGLVMLGGHPGTVAVVDVRGWISPLAAWEAGLDPERLVVVRCPDPSRWAGATAALLDGLGAVYAEMPPGVSDQSLRRLAALARSRRSSLLLRPLQGGLPSGVAHLRLHGEGVSWEGAGEGRGRLGRRLLTLRAGGKGAGGAERNLEVEDDGTNAVRVVPGLAAAPSRRAAG
jgi:hypothetical protein